MYSCGTSSEEDRPYYECPQERYLPTGEMLSTGEECPTDKCILWCAPDVCDAAISRWCEDCASVLAFVEGPCASCNTMVTGREFYVECGLE